ncbi:hypothetical protein [Modestobacter sp. NPDC049651]|uniref:hypothetical protein n=1 Tax=unclassified Modestobacter TaxID=2643866 RepID=UPI0033E0B080
MTSRDGTHLQPVPDVVEFRDNRVAPLPVDDAAPLTGRWAELAAEAARLDDALAPPRREPTGARLLVPVTAGLTVLLALLGSQAWQLPTRAGGGVTAVPQSLLTFLLLCAAVCVWAAGRLVRPDDVLGSSAAVRVWWLVVAGSAVVSVTAALSLASYAGSDERPGALAARCLVPLVPAVLAGLLARTDGRAARVRAALGTGVVTLPLLAVGWALLASGAPATTGDALGMTLLSGVAPFAAAIAFVAADRRR